MSDECLIRSCCYSAPPCYKIIFLTCVEGLAITLFVASLLSILGTGPFTPAAGYLSLSIGIALTLGVVASLACMYLPLKPRKIDCREEIKKVIGTIPDTTEIIHDLEGISFDDFDKFPSISKRHPFVAGPLKDGYFLAANYMYQKPSDEEGVYLGSGTVVIGVHQQEGRPYQIIEPELDSNIDVDTEGKDLLIALLNNTSYQRQDGLKLVSLIPQDLEI